MLSYHLLSVLAMSYIIECSLETHGNRNYGRITLDGRTVTRSYGDGVKRTPLFDDAEAATVDDDDASLTAALPPFFTFGGIV
jgi:hypothetical protein